MSLPRKVPAAAVLATAKRKPGRPRRPRLTAAQQEFHAEADEGDHIAAEDQAPASRSVIKPDRKKAFVPSELSQKLTAAVSDDKGRTDPAKLRKLAEANGCWQDGYAKLNVGMQRMNVGTRLRRRRRAAKR